MFIRRRIFSLFMIVCLLSSICLPVLAETWDLTQGSIDIGFNDENKQYVTQNSTSKQDDTPVITSGGNETANTITVSSGEDQTAQFTIQDVAIVTDQNTSGINIKDNSTVEMTVSGTNTVDMAAASSDKGEKAIVHVGDKADLTIEGSGTLDIGSKGLGGTSGGAGLGSNKGEAFTGTITIDGVKMDVSNPSGNNSGYGAAIGSGEGGNFDGTLNITNGADVIGDSGNNGAAIGAGQSGDFNGKIAITDSTVTATAYNNGAGIGGGTKGDFNGTLEIVNSDVKAIAGASGTTGFGGNASGIGGGYAGDFTGTVIIQDSTVEAAGLNRGGGIGSGGDGGDSDLQTTFSGTLVIDNSTVSAAAATNKTDRGTPIGSPTTDGTFSDKATVEIKNNSIVNLLDTENAELGDVTLIGGNGTSEGQIIVEDTSTINAWSGELDMSKLSDKRDSYKEAAASGGSYSTVPADKISDIANGAKVEVKVVPKPAAPTPPASVEYHTPAKDQFWSNLEKQIREAKKGDTITIDVKHRTSIPTRILELITEYEVTLIIKWNGGDDITVKPDHGIESTSATIQLKALQNQI